MPETGPPLDTLIHIADMHFWRIVTNPLRLMNKRFFGNLNVMWRRRRDFIMERAEPFADAVAATGVKSVLLTGDFASTATDEEFGLARRFVDGLRSRGLTPYLMPGNHDVYTHEAVRKRRFERHFGEFLPRGGYPARLALPGGTDLILAPTVCPRHFSTRGRITHKEIQRVAELLASCGPCAIVAAHYPVLHRTSGY